VIVTEDAGVQSESRHSVTALLLLDTVTACENVSLPEIAVPDELRPSKPLTSELLIGVPHAPLGQVPIANDATAAVDEGIGVGLGLDEGNAVGDAVAVGELVGASVGELDGEVVGLVVGGVVGEFVETGELVGDALAALEDVGPALGEVVDVGNGDAEPDGATDGTTPPVYRQR